MNNLYLSGGSFRHGGGREILDPQNGIFRIFMLNRKIFQVNTLLKEKRFFVVNPLQKKIYHFCESRIIEFVFCDVNRKSPKKFGIAYFCDLNLDVTNYVSLEAYIFLCSLIL